MGEQFSRSRGHFSRNVSTPTGKPSPAGLVTVVIPCFNQARYLREALASVHAQDWPQIESIVIDDGSTDETSAVATRVGATTVRRMPNQGLSRARNSGLELALGEFVIFLDADDELLADAARSGIAALERHPHAGCVAGRCRLMDAEGRPLLTTHPSLITPDLYRELLRTNFIWTPGAAIFRAEAVRAIGGFPVEHPAAADYALMLALARRRLLVIEPRDVVRYRKHDANMSRDSMLMLRATLAVLEKEQAHAPAEYRRALAEGRRQSRIFYGEALSVELRREWRGPRRPMLLAKGAMFLCRHCPSKAAMHVWRKITRVIRQLPPTDLDDTVSQESAAGAEPLI